MAGTGSVAGQRRGRYARGAAPAAESRALKTAKLEALCDRLRDESPLKHPAAREVGVRAVRLLLLEQARLAKMSAAGTITAEEARTVSSLASNLRRWFETLGVVELLDPDDEDGDL